MKPEPCIALLDNGSLKPAAVLALRRVAAVLASRTGRVVAPVSLLHSHKVPAELLGGEPAPILDPWVRRQSEAGHPEVVLVPFFLGPSRALTEYLPERMARLRAKWPALRVRVGPALGADEAGRELLAEVLAEQVRGQLARCAPAPELPAVALVDHGSPEPAVAAVRDAVAEHLRARLGSGSVRAVAPCSMERRPGDEYAFADPLLASLLQRAPFDRGDVVLALLFLSPGRHAGPDGDIAGICRDAEVRSPGLRVRATELLGGHPALIDLLGQRLEDAVRAVPL